MMHVCCLKIESEICGFAKTTRPAAFAAGRAGFTNLVMHENRQQNDDRQWNAEQPQQHASSETHGHPPSHL
jgi:hypothetical protein